MSEILNTEKLRQQIRELDAVRNYGQVKGQRDDALKQVELLQSKLKDYEQIQLQRDDAINNLKTSNENSIRILKEVLEELPKPPEQRRKDLIESGLPAVVESLIEDVVVQRLKIAADEKLNSIFKREVEKQVKWMLNTLWPTALLGRRTDEKEEKLKMKLSVHPFVALRGTWRIPCEECSIGHEVVLNTTSKIAKFLVEGSTTVDAISPHGVFERSYKVTISLDKVIKAFLAK